MVVVTVLSADSATGQRTAHSVWKCQRGSGNWTIRLSWEERNVNI